MRGHGDVDEEISWRASSFSGIAVAAHFQTHSGINAGRDLDLNFSPLFDPSAAAALGTLFRYRLSLAAAGGASRHHAKKTAATLMDASPSAARRAGFDAGTLFSSRAVASRADHEIC